MKINATFEIEMEKYKVAWSDFPWTDKKSYAAWLAQTYYYARHTTRIISFAGSLFNFEQQDIHNRFVDHTNEEKNHDRLLEADLKQIGYKVSDFSELSSTAAMYQTQYYIAQHVSPMALFGYFLSLEGLAVTCCKSAVETLDKATPGCKFATFLRVHAHEDGDHVREALDFTGKASPADLELIRMNLCRTSEFYRSMLSQCNQLAASSTKAA